MLLAKPTSRNMKTKHEEAMVLSNTSISYTRKQRTNPERQNQGDKTPMYDSGQPSYYHKVLIIQSFEKVMQGESEIGRLPMSMKNTRISPGLYHPKHYFAKKQC